MNRCQSDIFPSGKMKRIVGILFFIFTFLISIQANDWENQFQQGNEAYAKEQYANAIQYYQNAIKTLGDKKSSDLHFNIGNAYFQLEELGPAVLHYEKARLLAPFDRDIKYNLRLAQERVKGDISAIPPFKPMSWYRNIRDSGSSSTWAYVTLLTLWLAAMGLSIWLVAFSRKYRKWGFFAGLFFLLLSVLPFTMANSKAGIEMDSGRAVLQAEQTQLRAAPDGADMFPIYEGSLLIVQDKIGDWYEVRLVNGDVGWVKMGELERV